MLHWSEQGKEEDEEEEEGDLHIRVKHVLNLLYLEDAD
jgi:hypothetical protein